MKILKAILAASAILLAGACDKGETGDPATESRGDLNPPSGLVTLTGDGQVTLRWQGNNTEEDFMGYHVFKMEGDVTEGTDLYAYPSASMDLAQASLPRCGSNSALFEAFGFGETDRDCEGDTAADDSDDDAEDDSAELALQDDDDDDDDDADEEEAEALGAIVECATGGSEKISLAVAVAEGKGLGPQSCVIEGLTNGTTYSFFVASVLGEEYETISWTSNFVVDTPANQIFSGDLTFENGKSLFLPISALQSSTATTSLVTVDEVDEDDFESATCADEICRIGSDYDNSSSNAAGIYFGRYGGSKPLRVFFSTPEADGSSDAVKYAYRGAQTFDPGADSDFSTTIPNDQAAADPDSSSPYFQEGEKTPVYQNQVFDFIVYDASSETSNYGKVIFGARTVKDEDDTESDVTIPVTILLQETAGVRHYLK